MRTIKEIKEYCINIDLANLRNGDRHDKEAAQNIELFYSNIPLKDLLLIYSEHNGLKDYKEEEPQDYKESYSIDILDILENL